MYDTMLKETTETDIFFVQSAENETHLPQNKEKSIKKRDLHSLAKREKNPAKVEKSVEI